MVPHIEDFYMDGHIAIKYCKTCSAEGDKLFEECQGKSENKYDLLQKIENTLDYLKQKL